MISAGQPSEVPPTITQNGNVFKIELQAGRHKTTSVADQFNELSGGRNNEYAPSGDDHGTPAQLNFFFALQIQFEYEGTAVTQKVYVGQGSFIFTNNWWIGGSGIQNSGPPQLVDTAANQLRRVGE